MLRLRRTIETEKRTVAAMVHLYCEGHHDSARGNLCDACRGLLDYSHQRLDRCPYGGAKPSCKACPIHCYRAAERESMRQVMREAGPFMLWRHPWLAVVHLWKDRFRKAPRKKGRR